MLSEIAEEEIELESDQSSFFKILEKHCEIDPEDDLLKDDDDFLNFMDRRITITGNNRKITFRMSKKKKDEQQKHDFEFQLFKD